MPFDVAKAIVFRSGLRSKARMRACKVSVMFSSEAENGVGKSVSEKVVEKVGAGAGNAKRPKANETNVAATSPSRIKIAFRLDLFFMDSFLLPINNDNGKQATQTHRFIDDSPPRMVLFVHYRLSYNLTGFLKQFTKLSSNFRFSYYAVLCQNQPRAGQLF